MTVELLTDVSVVGTGVFADVAGLSFNAVANKHYLVEAFVLYQVSLAGTGVALSLNGPAAPSLVAGLVTLPTTLSTAVNRLFRTYNAGAVSAGEDSANAVCLGVMQVIFRCGPTSGLVTVRVAPGGTGVVTVKAGSTLRTRMTN